MKRFLANLMLFSLVVLLLLPAKAAFAASAEQSCKVKLSESTTVLAAPKAGGKYLGMAPVGNTYTCYGIVNGWYKIAFGEQEGYIRAVSAKVISGKALDLSEEAASSPKPTPTATPVPSTAPSAAPSATPTPSPSAVPEPTAAPKAGAGKSYNASSTRKSGTVWGSIKIGGTNINYNIYNNAIRNGQYVYSGYNYIWSMSPDNASVCVVMGHNMRNRAGKSNSMFHDLHHLQNKLLGKSKCERCGRSCDGVSTSASISYGGSNNWSLVCFYELSASNSDNATRSAMKTYNAVGCWTLSGSAKTAFIEKQLAFSTKTYNGAVVDKNVTANDKLLMLITCGDKTGDNNQALYMLFKAN